ncbi:MAG: argininosuccinate lyase, partial [Candidatus Bathyarchaeia archaeon]
MSDLLKGGRLPTVRRDVVRFTSSVKSDQRMLGSIIKINKAHVVMLVEQKIITSTEGVELLRALKGLKGDTRLRSTLEDAHMYVEEEVAKVAGPEAGGNLHIAKSRNDQAAAAIRMRLRRDLISILSSLVRLQAALISLADRHRETIMLGYTHLQPAQPVTFGHHLLAYVDAFERDAQRLEEAYSRVNLSPMGACALATTSFPISRERVAELLGFDGIAENSIDAVSSRDFVLETVACLAILAVNVSRMVEDLIVWSTHEFSVVEIPDQFASTSSIMPQKKNPDVLEVVRGRMSHVVGDLVACIATVKALPSTYNLDLQEVTPRLW